MGRYIQGPAKKQATLQQHKAQPISCPTTFSEIPSDKALVALLDNGPFDACAWIYDEREFKEFTDPTDPRQRTYWLMDLEVAKSLTGVS